MTNQNNKGFTLVELIIVLVILAILAAILVPALLGYIDEAKTKQDITNAKALMTAMQSELAKEYGAPSSYFSNPAAANDIDLSSSDFKKRVFDLAQVDEPYVLIMYTRRLGNGGEDKINNKSVIEEKNADNLRDCYTVYSVLYWSKEENIPIYYDFVNNEWREGSLYSGDIIKKGRNQIQLGSKKNQWLKVYVLSIPSKYKVTDTNKFKQLRLDINKLVGYTGTLNKN